MEKLEMVIQSLEDQIGDDLNCEYDDNWIVSKRDVSEAIDYLKEYRDAKETLELEAEGHRRYKAEYQDCKQSYEREYEKYQEAVKNCETAENKYRRFVEEYAKEKDEEFRKILREDSPLTWDEMRKMEGKPVWIDVTGWEIIDGISDYEMHGSYGTNYFRYGYGKEWTAYRNEQK